MKLRRIKIFEDFIPQGDLPYIRVFKGEGVKADAWKTVPLEFTGDLRITFKTKRGDEITADFIDIGNPWTEINNGDMSTIFDMVPGTSSDGQFYSAEIIYNQAEAVISWEIKNIYIR